MSGTEKDQFMYSFARLYLELLSLELLVRLALSIEHSERLSDLRDRREGDIIEKTYITIPKSLRSLLEESNSKFRDRVGFVEIDIVAISGMRNALSHGRLVYFGSDGDSPRFPLDLYNTDTMESDEGHVKVVTAVKMDQGTFEEWQRSIRKAMEQVLEILAPHVEYLS